MYPSMVVAWKARFPGEVSREYFILRASRILQVKNGTQQTRKLTEKDSHQLRRCRIRFKPKVLKEIFLMRKVIYLKCTSVSFIFLIWCDFRCGGVYLWKYTSCKSSHQGLLPMYVLLFSPLSENTCLLSAVFSSSFFSCLLRVVSRSWISFHNYAAGHDHPS